MTSTLIARVLPCIPGGIEAGTGIDVTRVNGTSIIALKDVSPPSGLPFLNVKDAPFHAVGNGATDDYPAFAAAHAALSAAGGGVLVIPPGNYNCISGSIKPPSNTVLQGAGIDATTIRNNVPTFPDDQTISIYGTMTGINTNWPGTNTTYPINAPTIGANTVTTTTPADASNFPNGTIIFISGGLHSTSFWYPGWHTTVFSTNPGTGVITLVETLPFGGSQITTIQKILSLKQNIAIRDMTVVAGKASTLGCFVAKNILVENVRFLSSALSIAAGTGGPAILGVCRNSMFRNCRVEGASPLELFVASDSYIEGCHLVNSVILVDGGSFDCGVINNCSKDPQFNGSGLNAIELAEYGQRLRVIGNTVTGVPDGFSGIHSPASPDANRYYSLIGNDISGAAYSVGNTGIAGAFAVCVGNHLANLQNGIIPDSNAPAFIDGNSFDNVLHRLPVDGLIGAVLWRSRASGGVKTMTTATVTPSVTGAGTYQLSNASPQTVTDFTGAEIGDEITITFGDGNTTLQASGNLQTAAQVNYNPPVNTVMSFIRTSGTGWQERSRSSLYPTGNGSVTQATSKATSVTLNTNTGQITMNNAALLSGATAGFTINNSTVGSVDVPIVSIASGATANAYRVEVDAVATGSFHVSLTNYSGGSLSEAVVLNFAVIKWVSR